MVTEAQVLSGIILCASNWGGSLTVRWALHSGLINWYRQQRHFLFLLSLFRYLTYVLGHFKKWSSLIDFDRFINIQDQTFGYLIESILLIISGWDWHAFLEFRSFYSLDLQVLWFAFRMFEFLHFILPHLKIDIMVSLSTFQFDFEIWHLLSPDFSMLIIEVHGFKVSLIIVGLVFKRVQSMIGSCEILEGLAWFVHGSFTDIIVSLYQL